MDNAFLGYACDVLADTGKRLTGSEIVKYCNRFAIDYNVRIPVDDVKMLQMNHKPQIPNKRTALKMNLETFELQQQIEIIRFLSELPKLKDNEDIKELINKGLLIDDKINIYVPKKYFYVLNDILVNFV